MTTFTTQDRQDAERDDVAKKALENFKPQWRDGDDNKLTEEVLRIGDALGLKTTSSDYNAFKVMEVIKQLIDASRLASKPMKKRPLTEEAIYKIYDETYDRVGASEVQLYFPIEIARAIERAHGIGE
jgi:hypothetical protein